MSHDDIKVYSSLRILRTDFLVTFKLIQSVVWQSDTPSLFYQRYLSFQGQDITCKTSKIREVARHIIDNSRRDTHIELPWWQVAISRWDKNLTCDTTLPCGSLVGWLSECGHDNNNKKSLTPQPPLRKERGSAGYNLLGNYKRLALNKFI